LMVKALGLVGLHPFETADPTLQLQWIGKARTSQVIGTLVAMGSAASLAAFGLVFLASELRSTTVCRVSGGSRALIAHSCMLALPQMETPEIHSRKMALCRRNRPYPAPTFMAGARRPVSMVLAAFTSDGRSALTCTS